MGEEISKSETNAFMRNITRPLFGLKMLYYRYKNRKIKAYKKLFANVVGGSIVVEMNDIPGKYEIDTRSHLLQRILLKKEYEPEIAALVRKRVTPDKDVINVGANIGIFTVFLAMLINDDRRILAIEPTPLAFQYLNNNIKRNNVHNKVIPYNGICSDSPGDYEMNVIPGKEEYSSIGESTYMANIHEEIIKIRVPGETLGNLLNKFSLDPGMILVDVEGAEMKVFTGAAKVLEKYKPVIVSELSDDLLTTQGSSAAEVIGFLEKIGYTVKNASEGETIKFPFNGNIIAIPNRSNTIQ